ncbi:SRPBCC family protein [Owenweeksia hongkongensis]|uniref:SRPBCC family protein n=1 Tax=Owenweeksia hongkongensis TaxID=253245 RepID=UPI003A91422C
MNIESKKVIVNKSATELYKQLENFENFGKAMPDSVTKFEADETSFLFGMKGMPEVRMVLEEKNEPELVAFKAASSKLDFSLACRIRPINDNSCEAYFDFKGKFNPMLRMMVEKPLKNFIEVLADKLNTI